MCVSESLNYLGVNNDLRAWARLVDALPYYSNFIITERGVPQTFYGKVGKGDKVLVFDLCSTQTTMSLFMFM